jgi:drug/metabolite transporter (DMT)-like permease
MTPVFALVFAHLLLPDEPMTVRKTAGLGLGTAGIAIIFWDQLTFGGRAFAGSVTVTLGAVCVAFAYVMMRRSGKHLHPSAITTGQMVAAVIPLLLYACAVEGNPLQVQWTRRALVAACYLALLGSVLAAWLNYWLLSRVGAVNLLVMGLIEPIIAILLGGRFIGESLNARAVWGAIVILFGVALTVRK